MKTLLIDGNSLINRAFYALPLLTNDEGIYTNAVYGFLKMFFKAVDDFLPDNVVCAFDLKQPTFRHERYKAYKAGRKKMPDELAVQIPLLKEVLTALGVKCVSIPGFEADDIIGTYARLSEEGNGEAVIITGDRDSFQLISKSTSVWYTKRGISDILCLTPSNIKESYGVYEYQVCDLKALMGDASDNIPGVKGIGEKTALTLIEKYGNIEALYEHIDEISGKTGEKLMLGKEDAFESKLLTTIVRNAPVEPLSACTYNEVKGETAAELYNKYGFKTLLERAGVAERKLTFKEMPFDAFKSNGSTIAVVEAPDALFVAQDEAVQYKIPIALDLLSGGVSPEEAYSLLQPLIENESIEKIFFDSKNAMHRWQGIKTVAGDVKLAEYLLNPNGESITPEDISARYGCDFGACAILAIHKKQLAALEKTDMLGLYKDVELPLARVLYEMENNGFYVDAKTLKALGDDFYARLKVLSEDIYFLAGHEFNINSPQQLGDVLFSELGLPAKKKTKKGYSTDNEVLESLEHPIIEPIIEYRQMQKLKSTYVDAMFSLFSSDGRIHTTFNQTVTTTGRLSSTEPNLQNIPVRYEAGRLIRKAFTAEKEGNVLVNADYSQIELRILAHLSGDETLINAFNTGEDIHARTAAEVFDVDIAEVTKEMRGRAKAVNFGIVYGISDFGLARSIGSTRSEANEFIEKYFEKYPKIKEYLDKSVSDAKRSGYAKTVLNRRRYIPELKSQNYNVRTFGERVAMNAPIQGSAADIIKLAMLNVSKRLSEDASLGRLILQVHDELIIETTAENSHRTEAMLKEVMENVLKLSVPLTAETNVGRTWFDLK